MIKLTKGGCWGMLVAAALLLAPAKSLLAQDRNFGLGVILGEPTGLSGKSWISTRNAVDFAAAWSLREDNSLSVHVDYLFHNYRLIRVDKGKMPFYYGIGGRLRFEDDNDNRIGVRIPFGLNYHFATAPIDIFFEIVPVVDLAPETDFDMNGAIGARFFF